MYKKQNQETEENVQKGFFYILNVQDNADSVKQKQHIRSENASHGFNQPKKTKTKEKQKTEN